MVLPWLAAGWLVGIAIAAESPLQPWQWISLGAVAGLAAWSTRREPRIGWAFLVLVCLSLGGLRASLAEKQRDSATITSFIGTETVDLRGTAVSLPAAWGDLFTFRLQSKSISVGSRTFDSTARGWVQVTSASWWPIRRGESVLVRGRLGPPSPSERGSVSAVLEAVSLRRLEAPNALSATALLDDLRQTIVERLFRVLPAGEASLVAGVLLGADEQMPADVQTAFRITGTAHILAVSGFNVTIVAAAAIAVFGRLLGARRGALAAASAIILYTLLCGAEAAVVRAALMAGVTLLALRLGRQSAAVASLAAAAIAMSLWNPGVIREVGFQLSFLATLGLVIAARPTQAAIRRWGDAAIPHEGARSAIILFCEIAALSLVAQAATLPLSAYVFHRLPLMALPANALILPAQPLLMATGAATAVTALVSLPIGSAVAWSAWPLAAYTIRVAELFASLPNASVSLAPFPSGWLFVAYSALAGLVLAGRWPKARATAASIVRLGGPVWLVGLVGLTVLVWRSAVERPDGRLHLTALPGGDVLIETPTGRFLALSAGPSLGTLKDALDERLPLTGSGLDGILLMHSEISPDDVVAQLARHAPQGILVGESAGLPKDDAEGMTPAGVLRAGPGLELDLGHGAVARVIPAGPDQSGLLITYGLAQVEVLESGRWVAPLSVQASGSTAVVLLGSGREIAKSLRQSWPAGMFPILVLAPLPGEPFPEDLLTQLPLPAAATPFQGWIRLSTDGTRLWVEAERTP